MTGSGHPPSATVVPGDTSTMDLHGVVLTEAFDSLRSSESRVLVTTSDKRQLSICSPVLLLFSPLLRSALASVGDSRLPNIVLPEVSSNTLMQLEDLLRSGKSIFPSLADCRAVLEASSLLGIPISSLATGDQGPALKINVGKQPELEASLFHAERRRRRVVLVSEDIARGEQLAPPRDKNTNLGRGGRAMGETSSNVQKPLQVKQEPAAEEELDNAGGRPGGATLPAAATNNQHLEEETSQDQASGELKNKCEKCFKGFPSLTLLRYHYCSHFRGLLKKKYAELFEENKCLLCQKTFANSGRLLLHIGVQHDKINEILKSKGLRILPPFMGATASNDSVAVSKTEPMESDLLEKEEATQEISNDMQTTEATPESGDNAIASPVISSNQVLSSSQIQTTPAAIQSTTAAPSPSATPSAPPPQENSQQESSTCNYDLECEVCSQKQRSIQLLEQHCCRHFMKELQEQYVSLMDGLRCTLCNNVFKQKHSLLLHIGCKHGKVNDILRQKGFAALPCPVNATNNAAMQKQLIQIKKEKMENVKDEGGEQKGNSTLDAILKKYKFTAGAGNKFNKA